jgi:hypothetical protein
VIEHGVCGSTKAVQELLAEGGVTMTDLRDCQGQAEAIRSRLGAARAQALNNLEAELSLRRAAHAAQARQLMEDTARQQHALDVQRAAIASAQRANLGKVAHHRLWGGIQLTARQLQTSAQTSLLKRRERTGFRDLARQTQAIARLNEDPDSWVTEQTASLQRTNDTLKVGLESTSFRGAIGEEQVAEALRALGEGYHVLHDLLVQLDHPVTLFERTYRSAQLDHVVVGPMGVAVLETKNWSPRYCARDDLSDPYQQTARGSHLVRCLLREAGLETKVYAVLARCNSLPPRPPDVWGSVLRPNELAAYLQKQRCSLSTTEVQQYALFLLEYLND